MQAVGGLPSVASVPGPWYIDLDPYCATGNYAWDSTNLQGTNVYLYNYFVGSDVPDMQYTARWWDIDFGAGGVYSISPLFLGGSDIGIYSFRVDGIEVGRVDGYFAVDTPNQRPVVTGARIPPGRHRFSVLIATRNASATNWYADLFHLYLWRTGVLPFPGAAGVPRPARPNLGHTVDIGTWCAAGWTSWDNTIFGTAGFYGAYNYSSDTAGATRFWYQGLGAGLWDFEVLYDQEASCGIVALSLDGVTLGSIDMYGTSDQQHRATIRGVVPFSGRHKIALTVTGKNGSATHYYGTIKHIQARQVRGQPGSDQALDPWQIDWDGFQAAGNSHFDTVFVAGTMLLYGEIESDGTVGASRWYYQQMHGGTWDFELVFNKATNRGIFSVQLDDVEVGTIDSYGAAAKSVHATISNIKVGWTGRHKIALVMNSKNGSSSAYYGGFILCQLRRTA